MKTLKLISLIIIIGFFGILLETTKLNFPFAFLFCAMLVVFMKKIPAYFGVIIIGFIIDSLRVSNFGYTSIFLFATILCILLYEKFSGSDDVVIAGLVIAVGTFLYAHFLAYSTFLVVMFFAIVISGWLIFDILRRKGKIFI